MNEGIIFSILDISRVVTSYLYLFRAHLATFLGIILVIDMTLRFLKIDSSKNFDDRKWQIWRKWGSNQEINENSISPERLFVRRWLTPQLNRKSHFSIRISYILYP